MFVKCDQVQKQGGYSIESLLDLYGYERLELKEYPGGFRMAFTHIPGVVEGDTI